MQRSGSMEMTAPKEISDEQKRIPAFFPDQSSRFDPRSFRSGCIYIHAPTHRRKLPEGPAHFSRYVHTHGCSFRLRASDAHLWGGWTDSVRRRSKPTPPCRARKSHRWLKPSGSLASILHRSRDGGARKHSRLRTSSSPNQAQIDSRGLRRITLHRRSPPHDSCS